MLSRKLNESIADAYTKAKRARKMKTSFDVVHPRDPSKVLKFSPHLEELIMTSKFRDTDYLSDHTDRYTAFKWKYKTQNSCPGDFATDRGVTPEAQVDVLEENRILIVSEVGVFVPDKERGNLSIFNIFVFGPWAFFRNDAVMRVNTRSIDAYGDVEIFNVKLEVMNHERLQIELNLEAIPTGFYVVVRNKLPIKKGDFLMVKEYETDKMVPFGTERYLNVQRSCFLEYNDRIAKKPKGRVICKKCFELLPKEKAKRVKHNTNCYPYIWNFYPPKY